MAKAPRAGAWPRWHGWVGPWGFAAAAQGCTTRLQEPCVGVSTCESQMGSLLFQLKGGCFRYYALYSEDLPSISSTSAGVCRRLFSPWPPSHCSCSAALVPAEAAAVQGKGSPAPTRSLSISFLALLVAMLRKLFHCLSVGWRGDRWPPRDIVSSPRGCVGMEHGWSLLAPAKQEPWDELQCLASNLGFLENKAMPEAWTEPPEGCAGRRVPWYGSGRQL